MVALILRGVLELESSPRKKNRNEDQERVINLEKIEERNLHQMTLGLLFFRR